MDGTKVIIEAPLHKVHPHPKQPRVDMGDLDTLASSIAELGVLEPVILLQDGADFLLVDGHRRVEASRIAGLSEVPAYVAFDWTEADQILAMVAMDKTKKAFTPAEVSTGLQTLLAFDVDVQHAARAGGYDPSLLEAARAGYRRIKPRAEAPVALSLDDAVLLGSLSEEAAAELEKYIGTRDFNWKGRQVLAREEAHAALDAAGIPVIEWPIDRAKYPHACIVTALTDEHGGDLKGHEWKCPGHAAYLDYEGRPHAVCLEPETRGHKLRDADAKARTAREAKAIAKAAYETAATAARERRYAFTMPMLNPRQDLMRRVQSFAARVLVTYGGLGMNAAMIEEAATRYFYGSISESYIASMPHMVMTGLVLVSCESEIPVRYEMRVEYIGIGQCRRIIAYLGFLALEGYELDDWERELETACATRVRVADEAARRSAEREAAQLAEVRTMMGEGACCGVCVNRDECDNDNDAGLCGDFVAIEPGPEDLAHVDDDDECAPCCASCEEDDCEGAADGEPCDRYLPPGSCDALNASMPAPEDD